VGLPVNLYQLQFTGQRLNNCSSLEQSHSLTPQSSLNLLSTILAKSLCGSFILALTSLPRIGLTSLLVAIKPLPLPSCNSTDTTVSPHELEIISISFSHINIIPLFLQLVFMFIHSRSTPSSINLPDRSICLELTTPLFFLRPIHRLLPSNFEFTQLTTTS
jgi:hypothetical protein